MTDDTALVGPKNRHLGQGLGLLLLIALVAAGLGVVPPQQRGMAGKAPAPASIKVPLRFEPNVGQADGDVKFLARSGGSMMSFAADGVSFGGSPAPLRMVFGGERLSPSIAGIGLQEGFSNYVMGSDPSKWHTGVPQFRRIRYHQVYPGVDADFYGHARGLEYDFTVAAGADPSLIKLSFPGAAATRITSDGNVIFELADGTVVSQERPVSYQVVQGKRRPVESGFLLDGKALTFRLGSYDQSRPLVIDPVLVYGSYLGKAASKDGVPESVALDHEGNVYLTGGDHPTSTNCCSTVTVTKFDPRRSAVLYSTYLGGDGEDWSTGIAVNAAGEAYVVGATASSNFPSSANAFQKQRSCTTKPPPLACDSDAFVAVIGASGALVFSSYLGGGASEGEPNGGDYVSVAVDPFGRAHIAGTTRSSDFPTTPGSFQTGPPRPDQFQTNPFSAFVAKIDPKATAPLVYASYLAGTGQDRADAIALDARGNASVTGSTTSTDFPVRNAAQSTLAGSGDAFIATFNADGSDLLRSTYLGGSGHDAQERGGVAVDSSSGRVYVIGSTRSTDFPTLNAFQTANAGASSGTADYFVAMLGPEGSLQFSTYLGGSDDEGKPLVPSVAALAIDDEGNAYVAGRTVSTDFPVKTAIQPVPGNELTQSDGDAVVAKVNPFASGADALVYSTYLGGDSEDQATGLAMDSAGVAHVVGKTFSLDFPTTKDAAIGSKQGGPQQPEVFLATISSAADSTAPRRIARPAVSSLTPAGGPSLGGTMVRIDGLAYRPDSVVRFGGVPAAEVIFRSKNLLFATSPPHEVGVVAVTVTTAGGESEAHEASTYTYTPMAWNEAASGLLAGRSHHSATMLDGPACRSSAAPAYCGKLLVAGGVEGGRGTFTSRRAELFDPFNGTSSATGNMAVNRAFHTATLLDGPECSPLVALLPPPLHCGKVLVAGGRGGDPPPDPSDEVNASLDPPPLSSAELYDPATGLWLPTGSLKLPHYLHAATAMEDGRVLLTGGGSGPSVHYTPTGSAELYDPFAGSWIAVGPMADPRGLHTATLLPSGKVLVAGGRGICAPEDLNARPECTRAGGADLDGIPDNAQPEQLLGVGPLGSIDGRPNLASAELFDPATSTWARTGPMDIARNAHSASLLAGDRCAKACGKVLVAGGIVGVDQSGYPSTAVLSPSTELYDERSGAWEAASPMSDARAGHSATPLADGTVLVAGGGGFAVHSFSPALHSAEIFDARSGKWRSQSFMGAARASHVATVVDGPSCRGGQQAGPCGRVVVTGGTGDGTEAGTSCNVVFGVGCSVVSSVELYTPGPAVAGIVPNRGPLGGGRLVTISGWGFAEATSVTFGTAAPISCSRAPASSCRIESGDRIVATAPPHPTAGPFSVVVSGPAGTSFADVTARFIYLGAPGRVTDLRAEALSSSVVRLLFSAPDDGSTLARATSYIVKQAGSELTESAFDGARSLCEPVCTVGIAGERVELDVTDLIPGATYHYAVKSVGPEGALSEMSAPIEVTTPGAGGRVCPPVSAAAGQVLLEGGQYRLVGLPAGTVVGSDSPLYGWLDQGAGGAYTVLPGGAPVAGGQGYWAWSACKRVVTVSNAGSSQVTMRLGAYRASMVGNPSGDAPATVTGHDFAATWEPGANGGAGGYRLSGFRELQGLPVGTGAWVFNYEEREVRVST